MVGRRLKQAFRKFFDSEDTLVRVLRNSAWLFSAKGMTAVLSFFYLAILTRTLGIGGFGQFAVIFSTVQIIAALLRFQTWHSLVRYGAQYVLGKSEEKFASLAGLGLAIEVLGAIAGCVAAYFLIPEVGHYFDWTETFIDFTRLYAIGMLISIRSSALGILRAHDRFRESAIADAMLPVGRMIGALTVLFLGPELRNFLFAWAGAEMLCAVTFWIMVSRVAPLDIKGLSLGKLRQTGRENPGMLRYFLMTNLFEQIAILREHLVVLVIGIYLGANPAGLFRLANQLANAVARIADLFARPLFTELARIYAGGDTHAFTTLFYRSLKISAVAGAALIVLLIVAGQPFLHLMAGKDFAEAYPLLVLMGGATSLGLVGVGLDPVLQSSGRAHISLFISLLSFAMLAALLYLLLPLYGAIGAAGALFVVAAMTLMNLMYFTRREVKKIQQS